MAQSQGDILAENDGYVEPVGVEYAQQTWNNELHSDETWNLKKGEGERTGVASLPVLTITSTQASATDVSVATVAGYVEDSYSELDTLTYEVTGASPRSGTIPTTSPDPKNEFGAKPTRWDWTLSVPLTGQGDSEIFVTAENVRGKSDEERQALGEFFTGFHYDEFDDDSISPKWDTIGETIGTVTEQNDRLEFNQTASAGNRNSAKQRLVKGIDGIKGFDQGFDIYYKVRLPTLSILSTIHSGADLWMQVILEFTGGVGTDGISTRLRWVGGTIRAELLQQNVITMNGNLGSENEVWFRMKFNPAEDTEINCFYSTTTTPATSGDWTGPYVGSKGDPDPTGHTNLDIHLEAWNADAAEGWLGWWENIRQSPESFNS